MPVGWLASAAIHAGIVLLLLFGLPLSWSQRDYVPVTVVPVEIVTTADVSNVRAISPPEEEEAAAEEAQLDEPTPEPEDAAEPAPERPRRNSLDLAALDAELGNLDKQKNRTQRRNDGAPGENPRPRAGLGTREAAALRDQIAAMTRAHMQRNRCWRAPADARNPESLVVVVRFRLDVRGHVVGRPQSDANVAGNPELRVARDRAVSAVLQCDPFPFADEPRFRDHYELWREMEFQFDPSQMAG